MKYICYYDTPDNKIEQRAYVLAATNKIRYIVDSIKKVTDEEIEIISPCVTKLNKSCNGHKKKIENNVYLKLFHTFGRKNYITKFLDLVLMPIQVFIYTLLNVKKGEKIIVYHSVPMITPVLLAKRIKKFHLILEMEEIYSDITGNSHHRAKEMKICDRADAYIFPTYLMDEKLNCNKKPSVIVHGTYYSENKVSSAFDDDKIHIIYAGTLDPRKGGALAAAGAAKYLPSNYHLHVLGFGTEDQIQEIKQIAIANNSNPENARLTYDGLLSGDEYIRFIQSCSIGLSTQNPKGAFNNTSFPSKILSYMGNGLHVVSAEIDVVVKSDIGDLVYYYQNQTPQEIANAIMCIDLNKEYNSRERLKQLDRKFIEQMRKMV